MASHQSKEFKSNDFSEKKISNFYSRAPLYLNMESKLSNSNP